MPITRREVFQLSVLLLIVPIQYWFSQNVPQSSLRTRTLKDIMTQVHTTAVNWFSVHSWINYLKDLLLKARRGNDYTMGKESPANEVLELRQQNYAGYFASSTVPRVKRPDTVQYRVGQVVRHSLNGYRGVIVGWDQTAKAPEYWLEQMYSNNPTWIEQPNYLVLVDIRDRPTPQLTYVPQENLKVEKKLKIIHPKLDVYFDYFDGTQYLPRPWLQTMYPRD